MYTFSVKHHFCHAMSILYLPFRFLIRNHPALSSNTFPSMLTTLTYLLFNHYYPRSPINQPNPSPLAKPQNTKLSVEINHQLPEPMQSSTNNPGRLATLTSPAPFPLTFYLLHPNGGIPEIQWTKQVNLRVQRKPVG